MMYKKFLLLLLLVSMAAMTYGQNAKKYTTHIVKSGETLRSIAKDAGCKVKEIKNLNPDITKNLKVNTTLVIPNKNFGKAVVAKEETKPAEEVKTHVIEAGNTFYGIAKKYNVTIQSIKDANPLVADGLKVGQKIRIPSQSEFTVQPESGKVVFYKVKQGDTKWRIASQHKISVADLDRLNPDLQSKTLQVDDNIWVPAAEEMADEVKETLAQEQDPAFIYHGVKQGEGLFRIAVIYDTTQDKIIELNPEATKKLRPGMLLKIPGKKKSKFVIHEVRKGDTYYNLTRAYNVSKQALDSLNPELEAGLKLGMILKIKELPTYLTHKMVDSLVLEKQIKLSFLMPLMSNSNTIQKGATNKQLQDICTDFYMGAQIAIDSLKKQGLQIEHHIYDTNNDTISMYKLLKDKNLKASDAVIGPFFFDNAQKVAKKLRNTPVITPLFSKKQIADYHENLIKAAVDKKQLTSTLMAYFKDNYSNQKIIIISDDTKSNKLETQKLGVFFKQLDSVVNIQFITPMHNDKRPEEIYMDKKVLEESVTKNKKIWVIMASTHTIITSDIVNTYGVLANDHNIRLFTTTEFANFDYINYQYLAELYWTFPAIQFDNLNSTTHSQFKEVFQRTNHTIPSTYAYTGFDLTYDTVQRLAYKDAFVLGLEAGVSMRLAQQFKYIKSKTGDYRNEGIMIVGFDEKMSFKILN